MSGARNTSFEESKIFQQAASQFMERLFCCTSSGAHHSQVYEVSTEYRTSSKQQQQQSQDLNESFLSENTLLASPTSTSNGNNNFNTSSIISSGLDLLSRSTGDKTLLSPAVQESPSPRPHRNNNSNNTPHPGSPGFIFLDGSASPPSRHHHRRNHSQNSISSASLSIGTPTSSPSSSSLSHRETQQYASPFAVIRRNETATTASVSSDDDMTQPSQIPAIQSSQTFDEDDGGEQDMVYEEGDSSEGLWTNNSFQHATVWSRGSDETTEPTHHLSHNNNKVAPPKQQSRHETFKEEPPTCTSPIPSLSTLRAAKQKSKQAASSRAASMDVRRLQAEFNQQRPTSRREQQQFIC